MQIDHMKPNNIDRMESLPQSGRHSKVDRLAVAENHLAFKPGSGDSLEWKPPAHGHQQSVPFPPRFVSGEFNQKKNESQFLERERHQLTEPSRNISITDNNLSVSAGQRHPDLKKLQLKAARLLMGESANRAFQERVNRFNQTLNNSVDVPPSCLDSSSLQMKVSLQQRNAANQMVDTHASVNLLQQKPNRRMHSNFHIPGQLKSNFGSQGVEGSILNHQSYDRIDHRSLNQFQLFNLRSSKNSKAAPGNIYLVNSNVQNGAPSSQMDPKKNTNMSTLSGGSASHVNKRFPVSTKAASKNLQLSSDARSQSIEKMILSAGERPDVTAITGLNLTSPTGTMTVKGGAAQQKSKKNVRMQDMMKQAQYRDIEKELESSEDDEEYAGSQMKNSGHRGQDDPLDRIMHMGTDSAKRRKRTAKLRKLQQLSKAKEKEVRYPPILSPENQSRHNHSNLTMIGSKNLQSLNLNVNHSSNVGVTQPKNAMNTTFIQQTKQYSNLRPQITGDRFHINSPSQSKQGGSTSQSKLYNDRQTAKIPIISPTRGSSNVLQQWPLTPSQNTGQNDNQAQGKPSTYTAIVGQKHAYIVGSMTQKQSRTRLAPLSPVRSDVRHPQVQQAPTLPLEEPLRQVADSEVFSDGRQQVANSSRFGHIKQTSALRNSHVMSPQPLGSPKGKVEMQVDISRVGAARSKGPKKLEPLNPMSPIYPKPQQPQQPQQPNLEAAQHLQQPIPERINEIFQTAEHAQQHPQQNQISKYARMSLSERRRFMQKIDEATQQTVLQNVFIKIWKLLIKIQYQQKDDKNEKNSKEAQHALQANFASQVPTLPLDFKLYQQFQPLLRKSLGALHETDDFVAQRPDYKNKNLFFDRFCFDLVSQLGLNIFKLTYLDIEYIFRTVFVTLSHNFQINDKDGAKKYDGVRLLQLQSIVASPFDLATIQKLNKKIEMAKNQKNQSRSNSKSPRQSPREEAAPPKVVKNVLSNPNGHFKKPRPIQPVVRSDLHNKPSLRETPKNMKRFGNKVNANDSNELKKSVRNLDRSIDREQAAKKKQAAQDVKKPDPYIESSTESALPNLIKPSVIDSNLPDSVDLHEHSFIQNSETETGTHWQNVADQASFSRQNAPVSNAGPTEQVHSKTCSKRVVSTLNADNSVQENASPLKDLNSSTKVHPVTNMVSERDELDQDPEQDNAILTADQSRAREAAIQSILVAHSEQLDLPRDALSGTTSPQPEEGEENAEQPAGSRLSRRGLNAADNQKVRQFESILKKQAIKEKIKVVQDTDSKAKAFEDHVYNKYGVDFMSQGIQREQLEFLELAQLKVKRRANYEPLLNGAIQATDGSLHQDELIGQLPPSNPKKNLYARKVDHQELSRKNMQIDLLGEFKNYDEIIFQQNMQNEVLKRGLDLNNLKPQEIRILQANKIDRKTILLNYMDLYDQAVQGLDQVAGNTTHQTEKRKEQLMLRLGPQAFDERKRQTDDSVGSQFQHSLDQYSSINKSREDNFSNRNEGEDTQEEDLVQIQKTNNQEYGRRGSTLSPRPSTKPRAGGKALDKKRGTGNEAQPKIVINQDLMCTDLPAPQPQLRLEANQGHRLNGQEYQSSKNHQNRQSKQIEQQIINMDIQTFPQTVEQTPESSLITQKESSGTLPQNDQSLQNLANLSGLGLRGNAEETSMIVQHGNDQSDSMQNLLFLGMPHNRTINVTTKELGDSEPYQQYNSNVQLLDADALIYQQHGPLPASRSNYAIKDPSQSYNVMTTQQMQSAQGRAGDALQSQVQLGGSGQMKQGHANDQNFNEMGETHMTFPAVVISQDGRVNGGDPNHIEPVQILAEAADQMDNICHSCQQQLPLHGLVTQNELSKSLRKMEQANENASKMNLIPQNRSQVLRQDLIADIVPKRPTHRTQRATEFDQPLSGEINLQKKALSPEAPNQDLLVPMHQQARKTKQENYRAKQIIQFQRNEQGKAVHFSPPGMDFNFELQVGTSLQFKIINAQNVQKIDQPMLPYKMDPHAAQSPPSPLRNDNGQPASSQMDVSVQNKSNFTSMLAKNKAQKYDAQQRSIDHRVSRLQQLEDCLLLNQSFVTRQAKVNERQQRSATRIRIQDSSLKLNKSDTKSPIPMSPPHMETKNADNIKDHKSHLKKPEQPKITMGHEEPRQRRRVIKEATNSIISASHFKSTLRDHLSENTSHHKQLAQQRSEITSPNDNSTISQRAHFRRRFMSQEGSRERLTIQDQSVIQSKGMDAVAHHTHTNLNQQPLSPPIKSPQTSANAQNMLPKTGNQSLRLSPGATQVLSEENQLSPKMADPHQDHLNKTEFGKTRNRSLVQNTNVAHVPSLETSQGFIEYYEDHEEVDRINQTLANKNTSRRRRSPRGALDYSFQKGDYSFRKLKLKNLKYLHPLFANVEPQNSHRHRAQIHDGQLGKKKKKQVLIQLNSDLPGATAKKFFHAGALPKGLLEASQLHLDLSFSLQHRKIESSLPQQKQAGTTLGTNESRNADQREKAPPQEGQILNIIDMDQAVRARQLDKRRAPRQGGEQQPSATRLPRENMKLLIVNQHGRAGDNAVHDSLRSSFDDEIDGRPGSLQPFKPRDSTQQNATPGHTARLKRSLASSERSPQHQTSLYRVDSGGAPPEHQLLPQATGRSPAERYAPDSLTASQRASLALEAADEKPNEGAIYIGAVTGSMAEVNEASGSIYVTGRESKLARLGLGQRDQHDADDLMTLNPNVPRPCLEDDEEMQLTMGNANMASKHLDSGQRLSARNLNQDIKSIASKEHLRGKSTTNKSAEASSPSQKPKGRASTRLREQQPIESFPHLASTVQVSKKIRKENESAQLQMASSKLSKRVNLREFNQTGQLKHNQSGHASMEHSKGEATATQQTLNMGNTTFRSRNSRLKSLSPGEDGSRGAQQRIGLKKNLQADGDSRRSKETADLGKLIDMAAAIETPINEVNKNVLPESTSLVDSQLFESTGANKLAGTDSAGFNNIVILDPKNVAQKQRTGRREALHATPNRNSTARRNQQYGTSALPPRSSSRSPKEPLAIMQVPVKELLFSSAAPVPPSVDPMEQAERYQPLQAQKKFIIRTNPALHRIVQHDNSSLNTLQNTLNQSNEHSREKLLQSEEGLESKLACHRKHFEINFASVRNVNKQNVVRLPHKRLKKKIDSKTPQGRHLTSRSQLPNANGRPLRDKPKVVIERHPSDESKDGLKQVSTSMNRVQKPYAESSATEDNNHKRSGVSINNSRSRGGSEMKFSSKFTGHLDQQTLENREATHGDDTLQSFHVQAQGAEHRQGHGLGQMQESSRPSVRQGLVNATGNAIEWRDQSDEPDGLQQLGVVRHEQLLELHIDGDDHDRRRVCLKQCCLQNAIQSKLKLHEKQDTVARMRQEREQQKLLKQQRSDAEKSVDSARNAQSVALAKPANAAPIALVHFADSNLEPWRIQNNN